MQLTFGKLNHFHNDNEFKNLCRHHQAASFSNFLVGIAQDNSNINDREIVTLSYIQVIKSINACNVSQLLPGAIT